MDLELHLKKINYISLIGTIMMVISPFFKFFSVLGVSEYLIGDYKFIIFATSLFGLVCVCLNKNIIVLLAGLYNLIRLIGKVQSDNSIRYLTYLGATHKYVEGFYLWLFGAILTIIGSIYWMSKNDSNMINNVSTQQNVSDKNIQYDKEINKKTSNETINMYNYSLNMQRDYIRIVIIGILGVLFLMFITYFSVGDWEEIMGLWKYKRAWIFDAKGLNQINGKYYYFNDAGIMQTGKQIVNNEFYFFNDDGSAKNGWVLDGNVWHFCKEDGSIVKDTWIDTNNNISTANGGTFYLDEYGNMVAGQSRVLNGKTYEFDSQGYKMFTFKVTNVYFNTSSDSKEKMNTISLYQPVYCHYDVECDEYNAKGSIYRIIIFPDGSRRTDKPNEVWSGQGWTFYYKNGIYNNPATAPTGNLTIQFYDMKNRLIGQGSVTMIK